MTRLTEIIRLELPSSFRYLKVITETIAAILSTIEDIPERDQVVYGVQLAVHEACTNIVEHAYGEEVEEGRIYVTFTVSESPRSLQIDLFDTGSPFEQSQVAAPNLEVPQEGGYGLYLIDQLMDEVRYETKTDGNYLYLTKLL